MKQVLISEELLRQALDDVMFLSRLANVDHNERPSVASLHAALVEAAPVQEPVAWRLKDEDASEHYGKDIYVYYDTSDIHMDHPDASKLTALLDPLYTAPQPVKQEPVLLLDGVIDAITDTIWGKQKVTSMYPTYRMYARTVEAATLLNQASNKQG